MALSKNSNKVKNTVAVARHEDHYFITMTTTGHIPVFALRETARVAMEVILLFVRKGDFQLSGFVIMPDHIHLTCIPVKPLADIVRDLKKYIARMAIRHLSVAERDVLLSLRSQSQGKRKAVDELWEKGIYICRIPDQKALTARLQCMYEKPVKYGLCKDILDYEFSDFHRHLGLGILNGPVRRGVQGLNTSTVEDSRKRRDRCDR